MSETGAGEERILLVDDNSVNLQMLYDTLDGQGFELLVARDGEAALALARRARPDLVLLDVMMPGIDGYETCRRLKTDPDTAGAAVIFCSARDETKDKVKGLDLGAVDFVTKPFQAEEVIARVRTHLKVRHLERDLARRNSELEAANAAMRRDLETAARVQRALLPSEAPEVPGWGFAWRYRPCAELAGDALNVFALDARTVCAYVLDVSGHGVPASLLSVAVTRSLSPRADRSSLLVRPGKKSAGAEVVAPSEVAARLNRIYPMEGSSGHYFTLLYGVLDVEAARFEYVSPGHPGPIRVRRGVPSRAFDAPGLPIGMFEDSAYESATIDLEPGDRLYLYSDGVYEHRSETGEEFGRDRLMASLEKGLAFSLECSVERLVDEVLGFRAGVGCRDDISILALECKGRG